MENNLITRQSLNLADLTKRDHFAFSFGRRVYPGIHLAERSLVVAMMRILWVCSVGIKSEAKLPLNPANYRGFMPANPGEALPVMLTIRSEERRRVIDEKWAKEKNN
jgi:hypothetical protein